MSSMKFKNTQGGFSSLLKDGYKHFGGLEEAILKNIEACKGLAAITRTSLGPNGMNKLVVNHLEKLFVTSDAATIVDELEVVHPAAKMLAKAAHMQVQEVGDGSNFVITVAGELLAQAEGLLRIGVHPAEIVIGYKAALEKALEEMPKLSLSTLANPRDKASLVKVLVPVIASKQTGYEDALAGLVADAILPTMPSADKAASVVVDNVRVCKIVGGNPLDSQVVQGVVVQRDTDGSVKHVEKARIAVFGCSIEASSSETKGVVVIKSPEELMQYNKGEERLMEETIKGIADAGATVVIAGGSISEIAMHFLEKYRIMAVRIPSKFELRRLCKAVGAAQLVRVGAPSEAEMGYADQVSVQELSSRLVTVFRQLEGEDSGISTIVLRGATMNMLDDMERAVDDAVHTARQLCKDARLIPGGGASEMELAHRLHAAADACKGLEMYSMHKFAESLEVVPRTLAENSGQVSTDIIAALYAAHAGGKGGEGVNVEGGSGVPGTIDCQAKGIVDCLAVKMSALRLAAETAITVLRVDQIIMSKQAGGPKPNAPGQGGDDD